MKHEEFYERLYKGIEENQLQTSTVVREDGLRFMGDEDGDVCIVYTYTHTYPTATRAGRQQGYYYLTLNELAAMVCDD